ncbi:MAG: hypothetical protein IJI45_15595 [Anaerolineaceae bacterium]|nr:hypothetical protein [Anaerolineaceae bacterium]
MEREIAIRDVNHRIENLAKLHPQYRIQKSEEYNSVKRDISDAIRINGINVRKELDPHVYNLYRRYFD